MNIAICDDESAVLKEVSGLLEQYCAECQRKVEYETFQSPYELLVRIEKGAHFDVLFLDILMNAENGIAVARELRTYDENIKIIFLTSSSEYAVQSYAVEAFYYQLKPVSKSAFTELMEKVFLQYEKENGDYFIVQCKNSIHKINVHQLEYCESFNRDLVFYLHDGCELKSTAKLQEVEDALVKFGCFLRVHRSYLINLRFVDHVTPKYITMTCNARIPVPHGKYTQTKDRYLEYVFGRRQPMDCLRS